MITSRWNLALVVSFCLIVRSSATALVPTSATMTYLQAQSDRRAIIHGERAVALFGGVLATSDTACGGQACSTTADFVDAFLADNPDKLGVDDVVLGDGAVVDQPRGVIDIRNGKFRVYTYMQMIECTGGSPVVIPVHGSVVKIPVLLGPTVDKISECSSLEPQQQPHRSAQWRDTKVGSKRPAAIDTNDVSWSEYVQSMHAE